METTTDIEILAPPGIAEACGVSLDTLRCCEREGLVDPIARAGAGRRPHSGDEAAWVRMLGGLRATATPIRGSTPSPSSSGTATGRSPSGSTSCTVTEVTSTRSSTSSTVRSK